MKRYIIPIILVFLGFGALLSCEKDDICSESTPTSPMLVIDFYEFLNPSVSKSFQKLEIFDVENPEKILVFEGENQILLPLKTDSQTSTYIFKLYYTNINVVMTNEDVVEIRYTKDDIYISRACGYKSNFTLSDSDPLNPNPKITDSGSDELWIKETIVRQPVITNENETHLDILF